LKNLKDWNISRKRYTACPYRSGCANAGEIEVIGSKEELKKKSINGFDQLKELATGLG